MSSILEYKCPNCASDIKFDSGSQKFRCESCDAEFSEQELNEIQWAEIPNPTIKIKGDFGEPRIEKTEQIGVYKIYISMKDGDPFETSSGQIPIKVTGSFESGLSKASGILSASFHPSDGWRQDVRHKCGNPFFHTGRDHAHCLR